QETLSVSLGPEEMPARDLARLPRAVARRLIRHAIRQAKGNLHGIEFTHIEQILELPKTGGRTELPGIHALRSFDWIRLEVPGSPQPARSSVEVPGRCPAPDGNSMICLDVIGRAQGADACATLKSDLYFRKIPGVLVLR